MEIKENIMNQLDITYQHIQIKLVKIWDSTMDIQRTLGYRNHYISNCCLGKLSDVYGYIWKYTE